MFPPLIAVLVFAVAPVMAQDSGRPMRLIIPFPAGGGSDAVGRIIAPKLGERAGQQVVVDNRAGAGGSIGTEAAVRAEPDGYNMVLASTSEIAINPALYKLGYDTLKDLIAGRMVASAAMVVVAAPAGPGSVKDLIALAKAKPGAVNVASAGNGTITHLSGELFRSMANLDLDARPLQRRAARADRPRRRPRRSDVLFAARQRCRSSRRTASRRSRSRRVRASHRCPTCRP